MTDWRSHRYPASENWDRIQQTQFARDNPKAAFPFYRLLGGLGLLSLFCVGIYYGTRGLLH